MEKKYFYNEKEGTVMSATVVDDDSPDNPRELDGCLCHLVIWWGRHSIYGDYDENAGMSSAEYVHNLLSEEVSEDKIWNYVYNDNTDIHLGYDRKRKLWSLFWIDNEGEKRVISSEKREELIDDVIDNLSFNGCWQLLKKHAKIFCLPVYGYEHGGITFSVSSAYPYNDRFDGGQAGFAWVEKDVVFGNLNSFVDENGHTKQITEGNWERAAAALIREEIKVYDMYLQNQVYGIVIEEMDEYGDFYEYDECYGFFSDKWGDELIKKIACEYGYNYPLFDTLEECFQETDASYEMANLDMSCMTLKRACLKRSELEIIAEAFTADAPWDKLSEAISILENRFGESGIMKVDQLVEAAEKHGIQLPQEDRRRHILVW